MYQDLIELEIQSLVEKQLKVVTEAEYLNTEYWIWFSEENSRIIDLKKSGLTDKSTARVAPIVEKKRSGESYRYYLNWKSFDNSSIRKINKSFSKHLRLSKGRSPMSIVIKNCTWEAKKVLEHESKLEPLRITLNGFREAENKLRAASRKINKINIEE